MQMESFGVKFDYKQERRCIIWFYAVKSMVAILLCIPTLIIYTSFRENYSPLMLISHLGPHIFEYIIMSNISTTYLTLIRCLRQRFITLNSLLRWLWLLFLSIYSMLLFSFNTNFLVVFFPIFFSMKRKKFSAENMSHVSSGESVEFIKFIGQQHSFLTDIMDLINICYSFQVVKVD